MLQGQCTSITTIVRFEDPTHFEPERDLGQKSPPPQLPYLFVSCFKKSEQSVPVLCLRSGTFLLPCFNTEQKSAFFDVLNINKPFDSKVEGSELGQFIFCEVRIP
jgi:hypothetical protein